MKKARGKPLKSNRDRVLGLKERWKKKGKEVRADSKYTGRKKSSKAF